MSGRGNVMGAGFFGQISEIVRRDWKTIPNLICYFRLLLIPVFLVLYIGAENYNAAAVVLLISGISDVADGFIARRFNMVSDFGKFIDPAADKLTQLAVFVSLSCRFREAIILVVAIALRELVMLGMGAHVLRVTGTVNSACWYGKLATFVTEASAMVLILLPGVCNKAAVPLLCLSIAVVIFSLIMYLRRYMLILHEHRERSGE